MGTQQQPQLSPEDYLAIERGSQERHEYYRGEMVAMGGASVQHNRIVTNVVRELSTQLKNRPCQVYANDMRVKVNALGKYTYPDLVVTCGQEQYDDAQKDTLTNPLLILEVLSESTEAYDRGDKFAHYRRIDSLAEYVLISQNQARVERFVKQADGSWTFREVDGLDAALRLESINCELRLSEVYAKVELIA